MLRTTTAIDLALAADQAPSSGVVLKNIQNIDASLLSSGVVVGGSSGANALTGGAGDDRIDGGGGADVILAGTGDDVVIHHGGEERIDGGGGSDTLALTAAGVTLVSLTTMDADQTSGDAADVRNFEHLDATALSNGVTVLGGNGGSRISTGSGADVIQAGGGADEILADGGDDRVDFWGSESSVDGGAGVNTLALRAAATVDLSQAGDQAPGVFAQVTNFQNVDAQALSASQSATITGSSAVNVISGGAGADVIDGFGGLDVIAAGGGADRVVARGAEASVDGGAGLDTLVLLGGSTAQRVDLSVAADTRQVDGFTALVTNFENLDAAAMTANLTVVGSAAANVLVSGAGNDLVAGGGGRDVIDAGAGDDTVVYTGQEDSIAGGAGTNQLILEVAAEIDLGAVDQSLGDLTMISGFRDVDASGLSATQSVELTGSALTNRLTGGAGADVLDGGGGQRGDVILAGAGDDTVVYRGVENALDGGTGTNTLVLKTAVAVALANTADQTAADDGVTVVKFQNIDASALTSALSLSGSTDVNVILGGGGDDQIDGLGGLDRIDAREGNDIVVLRGQEHSVAGGDGVDTLVLHAASGASTVDFSVPSASDQTNDATLVTGFENLDATARSAAVSVTGSAAGNVLKTGAGADMIDGFGGSDEIDAGAGDDRVAYRGAETKIDGGSGTNTLVLRTAATIALAAANQSASGSTEVVNFHNVDASALSASQAAVLSGTTAVNELVGGAGDDTIDGLGGADVVMAGEGADRVIYRSGAQTLDGGDGDDTLVLATGSSLVSVNLASAASDQTQGDTVTARNFENVDASTLTAAVTMVGSAGANRLTAGAGADEIDGLGGFDALDGGAGDDRIAYWATEAQIDGGTGVNTLVMKAAGVIDLALADQSVGHASNVRNFINVDASGLNALQGATLRGTTGENDLRGGAGDDTIDGRGGTDRIDAGAGADTVVFYGSETTIAGGAGDDMLILAAGSGVTSVNLTPAQGYGQIAGSSAFASGFESIDARALSAALTIAGSTTANVIYGGSGADTIDGGGATGGIEDIFAGAGNDTVYYRGGERTIDGGADANTLILTTSGGMSEIDMRRSGGDDQTFDDQVAVLNMTHLQAAALTASQGIKVWGSTARNDIVTGAGADVVDGFGGADVIDTGAGDDTVTYRGGETSLAGGSGVNKLVMLTAANIDLTVNNDVTLGDGTLASNFQTIDASAVTGAMQVSGTSGADKIKTGSGADLIQGRGGFDEIDAGAGDDTVTYWGVEKTIDGGLGDNTLWLKAAANLTLASTSQASGTVQLSNFQNVRGEDLTALQVLTVTGTAGVNRITGGLAGDTIDGGGGADVIDAGGGDDVVTFRGAEVSIAGGDGSDRLILASTVAGVTAIDLSKTGTDAQSNGATRITGFDSLDASAFAGGLAVTGSSLANTILGSSGDDTIDGGGGADVLAGQAGRDKLTYRGSELSLDGGDGDDTLVISSAVTGVNTIDLTKTGNAAQTDGSALVTRFENVDANAISSNLRVIAGNGANAITTGAGADDIDGGGGADSISAGAGADTIAYHGQEVSLAGGDGVDTLVFRATVTGVSNLDLSRTGTQAQTNGTTAITGFENVDARALSVQLNVTGSQAANTIYTGTARDVIAAGDGADVIDGGGGLDEIDAGAGDDIVSYHGSEDIIAGGAGRDTLVFLASATGIALVDLSQTTGGANTGGSTLVTGFEGVDARAISSDLTVYGSSDANTIRTGTGADMINGGDGADTIDGGSGADVLDGGAGDDIVTARGGEASITGGDGQDTLVMLASFLGVTAVDLSKTGGLTQTTGGVTAVRAFESVDASDFTTNLTVTGSTAANTIVTGTGIDTLDGGGGADVIAAGGGDDIVTYRGGETSIAGGAGRDMLVIAASVTGLSAIDMSQPGSASQGNAATSLTQFESIDATALSVGLDIKGTSDVNVIRTSGGVDSIDGGGGADTIDAGAGDDRVAAYGSELQIQGGAGDNTLVLRSGLAINLGLANQLVGSTRTIAGFNHVDGSTLTSGQNATVTGSTGDNTIRTGAGADTINAGDGADTVDGGGGADVIDGGAGDDRIAYNGGEISISGGAGVNTLVMKTAAEINFARADWTTNDTTIVSNFQILDASAVTTRMVVYGTSANEKITTGAGNDAVASNGGRDEIDAGAGDDLVYYHGSELKLDGGAGSNTLWLRTNGEFDLSQEDQSLGDDVNVARFRNLRGDSLTETQAIRATGSAAVNQINGGLGDDTINGGGGGDAINAGGGNDVVVFHNQEWTVDGGAGRDKLVFTASAALATLNLNATGTNQIVIPGRNIFNFEDVDASALVTSITVTGSSESNLIRTGAAADTIDGGGGADVIAAGAGNDSVAWWGVETTVDGGDGDDTLVVRTGATLDLTQANQSNSTTSDVKNFESVDARLVTGQSVNVAGTTGVNVIRTGSGADTIDGRGGADVIDAGAGDDIVSYYAAGSIAGGEGENTLVVRQTAQLDLSSVANQSLDTGANVTGFRHVDARALSALQSLSVLGSAEANTISAGAGADTIDGAGGADVIDGGGGADVVAGGAGDDLISYYGTETSLAGGDGLDTLLLRASVAGVSAINLSNTGSTLQANGSTAITGFESVDARALAAGLTITGSAGANVIRTGTGADTISAGDGADIIDGGGGADAIDAGDGDDVVTMRAGETNLAAGAGNDTLVLTNASTIGAVDLSQTGNAKQTDSAISVTGFENLDASAMSTPLSVLGSTSANLILTGAGNDEIDGRGGADIIRAGAGDDRVKLYGLESELDGGAGNRDVLVLSGSLAMTGLRLGEASQAVGGSVLVKGFEGLAASGVTSSLAVTASTLQNEIVTGSAADDIDGGGGTDSIEANGGDDIVSLYGAETLVAGGTGDNTLRLKAAIQIDLTQADQSIGDAANTKEFHHVDASALGAGVTVTGSTGANRITGGGGGDVLDGGGGIDTIDARGGDDRVVMRGGEDSISGGSGDDTLVVMGGGGSFDLTAADQASWTTNVTGFENLDASAFATGVILTGTSGVNTLRGGSGADQITGNGGADRLYGNGGDDAFHIDGASLSAGATIDGGGGSDTVTMSAGSGTISGQSLFAALTNVETIDFTASGVNASLAVSGSQIASLSGGAISPVTFLFNAGDQITITDASTHYDMSVSGQTTSYMFYDDAAHTQLVAQLTLVA